MEAAKKKILLELGFTEHYPSILEKIEIVKAIEMTTERRKEILNLLTGEDPQKRGKAAWKSMQKLPVDIDIDDERDEKAIILCYAYKKTLGDLFQS